MTALESLTTAVERLTTAMTGEALPERRSELVFDPSTRGEVTHMQEDIESAVAERATTTEWEPNEFNSLPLWPKTPEPPEQHDLDHLNEALDSLGIEMKMVEHKGSFYFRGLYVENLIVGKAEHDENERDAFLRSQRVEEPTGAAPSKPESYAKG